MILADMRVLSLFSGVGGFDMGLEAAGMTTVFQCEIDKHASAVLRHRWPDVPKWGDIATLTAKHVLAQAGQIDVIAWGSPCQDLSTAGRRDGLSGGKSQLFHHGIRLINELREETNGRYPTWSIWENVPGALSSNAGADFGQVLTRLEDAGACLSEWAVLDARFFGVPQRRRRVFVVSCFDPATAGAARDPILPVHEGGVVYCDTGREFAFYSTHGKQDQYQVGVAPPLKAISSICIASDVDRPRKLTPIEHERLMGWPDDHTATGDTGPISNTQRYKMCGNGVASPVAEWVGAQVLNAAAPPCYTSFMDMYIDELEEERARERT